MPAQKDVYTRYIELHEQWSKDPNIDKCVAALPMLVLAEAIENAVFRAVSQLKEKDSSGT